VYLFLFALYVQAFVHEALDLDPLYAARLNKLFELLVESADVDLAGESADRQLALRASAVAPDEAQNLLVCLQILALLTAGLSALFALFFLLEGREADPGGSEAFPRGFNQLD
jgi:hypothetical protein